MRFENKTALVSGAGGPMGSAVARRLASEGADLLITDISGRRLEANAEKLRADFPERRIVAHRASVLSFSEVQELVKQAPAPIDLIANIVGGIRGAFEVPLLEMTDERWADTFDLNVKGIIYLARELGPGMRERQYGRIVNISSVAMLATVASPTTRLPKQPWCPSRARWRWSWRRTSR